MIVLDAIRDELLQLINVESKVARFTQRQGDCPAADIVDHAAVDREPWIRVDHLLQGSTRAISVKNMIGLPPAVTTTWFGETETP